MVKSMKFGNCMNIINCDMKAFEALEHDGFDYVEGNLTSIAQATEAEFEEAASKLRVSSLSMPVCNCMFPAEIKVTGTDMDVRQIASYVAKAFERAGSLGVTKVVFGSDKSRNLAAGYSIEQGYDDLYKVFTEAVLPYCETYNIQIAFEPLRKPCNFINSMAEGMVLVERLQSKHLQLVADSIHCITSGEDLSYLPRIREHIIHVHISDWNRELPEYKYSSELLAFLNAIISAEYAGTMSFEANPPSDQYGLQRARILLKQKLGTA